MNEKKNYTSVQFLLHIIHILPLSHWPIGYPTIYPIQSITQLDFREKTVFHVQFSL